MLRCGDRSCPFRRIAVSRETALNRSLPRSGVLSSTGGGGRAAGESRARRRAGCLGAQQEGGGLGRRKPSRKERGRSVRLGRGRQPSEGQEESPKPWPPQGQKV